jgi:CubicO group peptidase (beta-lactamase class C family)
MAKNLFVIEKSNLNEAGAIINNPRKEVFMKKVLWPVAVVIIIILFAAPQTWSGEIEVVKPETVGMSGKVLAAIDEFAQVGMKANYFKGAVVLVARHGQICYLKSYGEASQDKPMQTDAIFRLASMTKPLVMAALMQFYDSGQFKLDDPLSKFIPDFKNLQVAEDDGSGNISMVPAKREITMHDLMSYTSGFSSTFFHGVNPATSHVTKCYIYNGVYDLMEDDYTHTLEDNVKAMAKCPLAFQPGEGWTYAHASHDIIGYLVEKFSGMPLDQYMAKAIFEPLKMNEFWFYPPKNVFSRIPDATQPGNAGALYIEETLVLLPIDTQYTFGKNKTYFSGGGGLHGTAYDYFRFGQMMLNKGELDGVRVLSNKAVELMTQPIPGKHKQSFFTGNFWAYGVEVQVEDAPSAPGTWLGGKGSYGWRGIWSTLWNNDPIDDTVVILMTQVGADGAFPTLYMINTLASAAVVD